MTISDKNFRQDFDKKKEKKKQRQKFYLHLILNADTEHLQPKLLTSNRRHFNFFFF